jgi:type IV fimbrial biogenesis protein FimT
MRRHETTARLDLIELLIAARPVAAGSCGLALPALANALRIARSASGARDLLASLVLRTGAPALEAPRGAVPQPKGAACSDGPDWSSGWLVFLDSNASRELEGGEPACCAGSRPAGARAPAQQRGRTRIVFQGNGGNAGAATCNFTLCDGRGRAGPSRWCWPTFGRLRDVADPSACRTRSPHTCPR